MAPDRSAHELQHQPAKTGVSALMAWQGGPWRIRRIEGDRLAPRPRGPR